MKTMIDQSLKNDRPKAINSYPKIPNKQSFVFLVKNKNLCNNIC